MVTQNRSLLIIILGLLSAIGPFSIDMYLPGFPAISADLKTSEDQVAYSLSSFFVGLCLGQLACGPLLDRFGRKTPLLIGLVIYSMACVGCALSTSIEVLIGFRFMQALGCCVCGVAPNAIVRDIFPVSQSARILSMLVLILGASPILAPSAGSYVVATFGWQAVFYVSVVVAALLFGLVLLYLPESRKADSAYSLRPASILNAFAQVMKEPRFMIHTAIVATTSAGIYAYVAGSPLVFMRVYKMSEGQFGLIFGFIAAGLIACSQLNRLLLRRYSSKQIFRTFLWLQMIIGCLLVAGTAANWLRLYSTVGLLLAFVSCRGFIAPNGTALALAPITQGIGSASALLGSIQMMLGALAAALMGFFFDGTALSMMAFLLGSAVTGLLILLIAKPHQPLSAGRNPV